VPALHKFLATLSYNLRFPGQYYQAETGLSQNMQRDFDPQTGRYIESDPIGLDGGVNTYSYVFSNPLSLVDPSGLKVEVRCRTVGNPNNPGSRAGAAAMLGGEHCYIVVTCPFLLDFPETTISYLEGGPAVAPKGGSHNNDTIYSAEGRYRSLPVRDLRNADEPCPTCRIERCILGTAQALQNHDYRIPDYSIWGPNSNSFARRIVEGCGGQVLGRGPPTGWNDASRVGF
jgi:RHS repeat-associated protein